MVGRTFSELTNFRRFDTDWIGLAGRRAFFKASADPFGTNPMQLQQVFAVDTLGRHPRQVTQFRDVDPARECAGLPASASFTSSQGGAQDTRGRTLVFDLSCDAFEYGRAGRAAVRDRSARVPAGPSSRMPAGVWSVRTGSLTVELPGPFAYSELRR